MNEAIVAGLILAVTGTHEANPLFLRHTDLLNGKPAYCMKGTKLRGNPGSSPGRRLANKFELSPAGP